MEGFLSRPNSLSPVPGPGLGRNERVRLSKADTYAWVSTAALFTITQTGKHPLVSVSHRMEKLGPVPSLECSVAVKKIKYRPAQHGESPGHNVEPNRPIRRESLYISF